MAYVECSAKTDFNVSNVFTTLTKNMIQSFNGFQEENEDPAKRGVFQRLETNEKLGVEFGRGRKKRTCCGS